MNTKPVAAQARMYLNSNRPSEAIRVLARALAEQPDDPECLRLLANAYLAAASGSVGGSNAMPAAQRAIELNPKDAHAWRLLSLCYTRMGWHAQAREAARSARTLSPHEWVSHTVVAHADASAKVITADTRASVEEAVRLAPNEPEVHFAAGHVAQASRQGAEAGQHYARTLALNPEHAGARNNLALIDMRRGDAGVAARGFSSLLAQNPNSDLALRNLMATGFSALRVVYLILAACIFFVNITSITGTPGELRADGIVIAGVAVGSVVCYVLWIRSRAGAYFMRFVRSVPSTDKLLMTWAIILVVALACIVLAVLVPRPAAVAIYRFIEYGLIGSIVVVSLVSRARRGH